MRSLSPALASPRHCRSQDQERIGLQRLPYDVLLHIASFLDVEGLTSLGMTCQPLHGFCSTRPVYRRFANDLLRRCRALPLKGFQRVSDLTTSQLIRSVQQAAHYESAWRLRGPRPVGGGRASSPSAEAVNLRGERKWYTIVSTPPDEEIDWLSPITSSYTLCATKSGKVVCWDVRSDTCLAQWIPEEKWELWKCRVEFEQQTVYFTMARLLSGTHEDDRVMEFILMRLDFSEAPSGDPTVPPDFRHVSKFRTMGVVMNVFLLDPPARLLSAFIYIARTNNIGLYVLLDWDKDEYVFIDTGIECDMSSNWSCILFERNVVIHSEDSDTAYQHFYPISLLQTHSRCLSSAPHIVGDLRPALTVSKTFTFPASEVPDRNADPPLPPPHQTPASPTASNASLSPLSDYKPSTFVLHHANVEPPSPYALLDLEFDLNSANSVNYDGATERDETEETGDPFPDDDVATEPLSDAPPDVPLSASAALLARHGRARNPFPFPHWYPESVHFVRQWWPSLPGIPRVSCTVCLLVSQDVYGRARFVLAQHYFRVPMCPVRLAGAPKDDELPAEGSKRLEGADTDWRPLEGEVDPNAAKDGQREEGEDVPMQMCCRVRRDSARWSRSTLGHAVWLEYAEGDEREAEAEADLNVEAADSPVDVDGGEDVPAEDQAKRLRFVTFPLFDDDHGDDGHGDEANDGERRPAEGQVRTLEVPKELDLNDVETINIDQSQGAVVLSVREGKIFILCYD
ncbi:hypothetical protein BD626DRAFT_572123 [Schizophyllum amplum]|uniref:F-box domain-containing protein n=1 Tax=Schizophyllum amplum TaxID=97359 RepID=A0A550C5G4_9AGAR|nr:hypothetical protein BD626DRAFT_572123 [Auriculariopsis ampla]